MARKRGDRKNYNGRKTIGDDIRRLRREGRSQRQATAIALTKARRRRRTR